MSEHLENVRRITERGLNIALSPPRQSNYADIFQHALDELERHKQEPSSVAPSGTVPISKLRGLVKDWEDDGDEGLWSAAKELGELIKESSE